MEKEDKKIVKRHLHKENTPSMIITSKGFYCLSCQKEGPLSELKEEENAIKKII